MIEFRPIPGYPGYEVSRCGVIRPVGGFPLKHIPRGRFLYPGVSIRCSGRKCSLTVHRAVALAWVPGRTRKRKHVAHRDGNRDNPHADNLMWATQSENERHKAAHGTSPAGARNPHAKLTDDEVRSIRALRAERGRRVLAEMFGVSVSTIYRAASGRTWAHVEEMV